jgi:predicted transcriptional regulator
MEIKRRRTTMSLDKNDIKHGIDSVAEHLKDAVDRIAEKTSESREKISEKAKEMARKTGDEMIEQGQKLKNAAGGEPGDATPEKAISR